MRILVTGAAGSLGTALVPALEERGHNVLATDVSLTGRYHLDVTSPRLTEPRFSDLIYHLAGIKYAPEGELDPERALYVNAIGTANVLAAGVRTITASTCKACDPETVYGASKLIAERLTLAAGGSVARFYNIRESSGNVIETWAKLPKDVPLPVTPCSRYFIGIREATELLLAIPRFPPGRYTVRPEAPVSMIALAQELYPGRPIEMIPPRRGDRLIEPLHARSEKFMQHGPLIEILSAHDAVPLVDAA